MSSVEAADVLKFLTLAGTMYQNAHRGYQEAKALAAKAGVSKTDLDAADARFGRVFADPLASPVWPGTPDEPPATRTFQLETILSWPPDASLIRDNEELWQKGEELEWMVKQKGVGVGQMPWPWHRV
jgi:hypothetical protein